MPNFYGNWTVLRGLLRDGTIRPRVSLWRVLVTLTEKMQRG